MGDKDLGESPDSDINNSARRPGRRRARWKTLALAITTAALATPVVAALMVVVMLVRELAKDPYPYYVPYGPTYEYLTEDLAMQRIVHYLQQTADDVGVSFSLTPSEGSWGRSFSADVSENCYTGYRLHGPQQVRLFMWVNGVPWKQADEVYDRLRDLWTSWPGWKSHGETGSNSWAAAKSPDGYILSVTNPHLGDGWLSVQATSPCYLYRDSSSPTQSLHPYPDKKLPDIVPAAR
ncbi:hypothetical protein ACFYTQ_28330 [Nocardia sp. NPDC004068]|uniref:hypothetical protein n=1 Tax=Nocardia sp. NPDC004068 TaxID=3364303 RepID=UPI00368B9BFF